MPPLAITDALIALDRPSFARRGVQLLRDGCNGRGGKGRADQFGCYGGQARARWTPFFGPIRLFERELGAGKSSAGRGGLPVEFKQAAIDRGEDLASFNMAGDAIERVFAAPWDFACLAGLGTIARSAPPMRSQPTR